MVIGFYGMLEKYTEPIKVPSGIMSYEIVVDTNFVLTSPIPRSNYAINYMAKKIWYSKPLKSFWQELYG